MIEKMGFDDPENFDKDECLAGGYFNMWFEGPVIELFAMQKLAKKLKNYKKESFSLRDLLVGNLPPRR